MLIISVLSVCEMKKNNFRRRFSHCPLPGGASETFLTMQNEIHLNDVLRLLDEKTDPDGKIINHRIGFITFSRHGKGEPGRYRIIERGHKTGLPWNVKKTQMRGIMDDITGDICAVHNRLILMFDNMKVTW